jgi:predicted phage gp36 major capsid-like protein
MTLIEKRQELTKLAHDFQAVATKADISAEERTANDKRWNDYLKVKEEIADLEKQEEMRKIITASDIANVEKEIRNDNPTFTTSTADKPKNASFYRSLVATKDPLLKLAKTVTESEKRAFGISASNVGAATVPTEVFNRIIIALRPYGWWQGRNTLDGTDGYLDGGTAEIIRTSGGYPLNIPLFNDVGVNATIVGDGATISADTSTPFGVMTLNAYKFVSSQILVSYELLEDAAIDIDTLISTMIAQRMGRAINYYTTVGTGTSQPKGIITAAPSFQSTNTGKSGVAQFTDIMKLVYSVNASYRDSKSAAFMASDAGIQGLLSLTDSNNRPLVNFSSIAPQYNQNILGYPVISNWDMAAPATSAKSLLFGSLQEYKVRFADDLHVITQVESTATTGSVGFVAMWRADANLALPASGTVNPVMVFEGAAT